MMKHVAAFLLGLGLALSIPVSAQSPPKIRGCATTTVALGGTAVTPIVANDPVNGFYIVNPLSNTDQGVTAEPLYVDPTTAATTTGNGTNTAIAPGNSYSGIPGSQGPVSVNAATNGHRFTCVRW